MTSVRRFSCRDLFSFNTVNLDYFTETYNLQFYMQYLARWPEYCLMAVAPNQNNMAYILGKAEGKGRLWHGHVTAVTVGPPYRRQGLAQKLMNFLEDVTINRHNAYFVDLFVRVSNAAAINMYKAFGYTVYRTVLGYYSNNEDAYGKEKNALDYIFLDVEWYRQRSSALTSIEKLMILCADMRKAMPRDKEKKSIIPLKRPVRPHELEFD